MTRAVTFNPTWSRRQMLRAILSLPAALTFAGCAGQASGPQAPEINYGYDTCAHCGMLIMDKRYAAATALQNGEVRKFDNVADMIAYHAEHPEQAAANWWAHDYTKQEWVDALSAHYVMVLSKETCSSLQKDIVAFGDSSAAEAFATNNQERTTSWDKVRLVVFEKMHEHSS